MNLKELHTAQKDIQTEQLIKVEQGHVISLQIEAEKQLKKHVSKVPAILVCISGVATYKEQTREISLKEGDYVFISSNVPHEVNAIEKSNFLLIK